MRLSVCKHAQLYTAQRLLLLLAGRQPPSSSTPLPTVADGHQQPYDLYSSMITLTSAVIMGGAYDGGGASPVGQQGHVICCSGR